MPIAAMPRFLNAPRVQNCAALRTADFARTANGALCIMAERIEAAMRTNTLLHTFEGVIEDTLNYSAHWKET